MFNKVMLTAAAGASTVALAVAAPAYATNNGVPGNPHTVPAGKVGICHATGSSTNPYVFITVDEHAVKAHQNHQDHRDIIGVQSAAQCPKPHLAPGKGGSVLGSSTQSSPSSQPTPSTLPDTGAEAGLSALIGLPALAVAGRSYLRAKRIK